MTTLVIMNGDLEIVDNNIALTVDNSDDEVAQRISTNLRTYLAEWFLDTTLGIPYLELVFVKGVDADIIAGEFKNAIIETPGVLELVRFDPIEIDPRSRTVIIRFAVRTVNDGLLEIEEVAGQ